MRLRLRNDLVGWHWMWLIWDDDTKTVARTPQGNALAWPGKEEDTDPNPDAAKYMAELEAAAPKAKAAK